MAPGIRAWSAGDARLSRWAHFAQPRKPACIFPFNQILECFTDKHRFFREPSEGLSSSQQVIVKV
jgi:hypothetical protein